MMSHLSMNQTRFCIRDSTMSCGNGTVCWGNDTTVLGSWERLYSIHEVLTINVLFFWEERFDLVEVE